MNHPAFPPLRNTALPHTFRQIRIERAREHGHPEGDSRTAYILIAPLDDEGRIDATVWAAHKEACRVVRKRADGDDSLGHLVRGPGGHWRFHYDVSGKTADESGHHFENERFELGEYVSVREADGPHAYRVVAVNAL
ncbi:hypothetical protein [Bradyrhizobium sp. NP1]|jgi:hypothetical protein|uniref:hypothetical protein n=1 Tax=Bradyrhizobium sp. NP1 TaxID=3049772 RepID=UPI0025A67CC7|nr:hypothetical protein [Bradyrhizobium sp. NP1]WJR78201.1 hypothetical protein QOU61_36875 [Bradyrhizobium sp. NP1]